MVRSPMRRAVRAMRTATPPRLAIRTEENMHASRATSGQIHPFAYQLSRPIARLNAATVPARSSAAARSAAARPARAAAVVAVVFGSGGAPGSAVMMLTGGIEAADGKSYFDGTGIGADGADAVV